MTTCSRRNFVSGMGALILMTGTAVKSVAQEKAEEKPIRYAMLHDETACIGRTACMDACRETNQVPEGVSRLEIIRSEPYGEFPNVKYEFFRHSCQHCTNAPCVAVCPTGASYIDASTGIVDVHKDLCVEFANIALRFALIAFALSTLFINLRINVISVAIQTLQKANSPLAWNLARQKH